MSTTVTVSNSLQLAAALKAAATAKTPETILLAGGTYSHLDILNENPTANITIQSASSANPAVIQGTQVYKSSNITFNNIEFTTAAGQPTAQIATSWYDNNVNFTNDKFLGPVQSSYASAPMQGVVIADSTNSTVSGSTFQYVQNGVSEKEDNNVTISNNSFSNIFGDGIDNAASTNVNIMNNTFTNMHIDNSDSQHSDCIQFWTSGEKTAGGNITIEGNSYTIGSGNPVQGIFITDPVGTMTYTNVTVENNDLVGTGWNGITLQHVSNALVENNILQTVTGLGMTSRLTLDGGVTGMVANNKIGQLENVNGNPATLLGNTTLPPIALSLAAQALVSGMASIAGSAGPGTTVPLAALASANAYLASHPISIPKA